MGLGFQLQIELLFCMVEKYLSKSQQKNKQLLKFLYIYKSISGF